MKSSQFWKMFGMCSELPKVNNMSLERSRSLVFLSRKIGSKIRWYGGAIP